MYSFESMKPTKAVAYVDTFPDLSKLPNEQRQALASVDHVLQIKCYAAGQLFDYTMPANVFKAFSPDAFEQAFQIPGEAQVGCRSILLLPRNGIDAQALTYICDWMIATCKEDIAYPLPVKGNFFAHIELMKASLLLRAHAAEVAIWPNLALFISNERLEWQHLETIMTGFTLGSKVVKHLVHNVQFRRSHGDSSPSCEHFINSHEVFQNLLEHVAYHQYHSAVAAANTRKAAHVSNAAYHREDFEEKAMMQPQQNMTFQNSFHNSFQNGFHSGGADDNHRRGNGNRNHRFNNRGRRFKNRGNSRIFNNGGADNMQRVHSQESWVSKEDWANQMDRANQMAAHATWDDTPGHHQGGAYDFHALNPGEATASGLVA